jgi:hypothetical protein
MIHPKRYLIGSSLSTKLVVSAVMRTMTPIYSHTAYENVSWCWLRGPLHTLVTSLCNDSLLKSFGKTSKKIFPPVIADVFCTTKSVLDLIKAIGVSLDQVCLLDPKAERELSPDDTYTNFLFGVGVDSSSICRIGLTLTKGILGNDTNHQTVTEPYMLQGTTRLVIEHPSFEC